MRHDRKPPSTSDVVLHALTVDHFLTSLPGISKTNAGVAVHWAYHCWAEVLQAPGVTGRAIGTSLAAGQKTAAAALSILLRQRTVG
jgi:hypothetical protein